LRGNATLPAMKTQVLSSQGR